jgi:hypothetical protein
MKPNQPKVNSPEKVVEPPKVETSQPEASAVEEALKATPEVPSQPTEVVVPEIPESTLTETEQENDLGLTDEEIEEFVTFVCKYPNPSDWSITPLDGDLLLFVHAPTSKQFESYMVIFNEALRG